jgi:hypothetical protein
MVCGSLGEQNGSVAAADVLRGVLLPRQSTASAG